MMQTIYPNIMRVLTLLSQGHSITKACDACNISASQFHKHIHSQPDLEELFLDAEQRGFDTMADALLEIFTHPLYGESDDKKAKVISENIKWYLAKKKPSSYGDRQIVETHITADKAIVEALSRGRERAERGVIEDATYKVIEDQFDIEKLAPELRQFVR